MRSPLSVTVGLSFTVLLAACGGGGASSPSPAPTPVPPPVNGFLYLRGSDGYWGFRVGDNGQLTAVVAAPLSSVSPVFSSDGTRVALWDTTTLTIRAVSADGSFGSTLAQVQARPMLRNQGNFGYRARWNPQGTQVFLMGGHGTADGGFNYYEGEIVGFNFTGSALSPLGGGVKPIGVEPTNPLFPSPDVMVVRCGGILGGINAAAEVRSYSTAGAELRAGNAIGENIGASTMNLDAFLSRDGRYVVAGDSTYSVLGSTLALAGRLSRTGILRLSSFDEVVGLTQMRGPFVLAAARRNRGDGLNVYASFRVEGDGSFSPIGGTIEKSRVASFLWGALQGGRVVWITDQDTREFMTVAMNEAGELGSLRGQAFSVAAPTGNYLCGSNLNGRFLYCFGAGIAAAATVGEDGTLTAFSPFASPTTFPAIRWFPISKP